MGQLVIKVQFFVSSSPSTTENFFNIGLALSPRNGAAADARSPIGKPQPLCFLYIFCLRLFLPAMTPFPTDFFPLI